MPERKVLISLECPFMSASPASSWAPIAAILAVFIILLPAIICIVMGILMLRRKRTEHGCGKCGYAVRGLTTLHCPECGSDLREVGIVPPTAGPALPVFLIIAGFVIILVLFGSGFLLMA